MATLMTQQQAAEKIGVSRQVVNNWIRRGKLPVYEKYGVRLVALEDVKELAKLPVDTVNK